MKTRANILISLLVRLVPLTNSLYFRGSTPLESKSASSKHALYQIYQLRPIEQTSRVWGFILLIVCIFELRNHNSDRTRILLDTTFLQFSLYLSTSHHSIGFTLGYWHLLPRVHRFSILARSCTIDLKLVEAMDYVILSIEHILSRSMVLVTIESEKLHICLNNCDKTVGYSSHIRKQERISIMDLINILSG